MNWTPYPAGLRVADRKCLVVGGGKVAERKVATLLEYGAKVILVAPKISQKLQRLANEGKIKLKKESYSKENLKGAFLVIAATEDREINRKVSQDAEAEGILINVADDPDLCSFLVPATLKRASLTISISTSAQSPALAQKIKRQLEKQFGQEYGILCELLGETRKQIKASPTSQKERSSLWQRVLENSEEILEKIRQGKVQEARELINSYLNSAKP